MKTGPRSTPGKRSPAAHRPDRECHGPTLQQQLRSTLGDNVTILKAIGVTIATDGQVDRGPHLADHALASNPDAVSSFFSASGTRHGLDATLTSVLDSTDVLIKLRNDSLNATLKDLQDQTTQLDARMTKLRAALPQQYSAMEGIVTQMKPSAVI
jgi:flagellar capping protein FliD